MDIEPLILEETVDALPEYGRIPISFEVRSLFRVELAEGGLRRFRLSERPVAVPWIKDYDAAVGEGPMSWVARWDISGWGVVSAFTDGNRVGGCVIAGNTPGVHMLEERNDIAALWDIRVAPECRGRGIGGLVVESAADWACRRNCRTLVAETQNINVPACRFYAKHGFVLHSVNRLAYRELPDETELIWRRELQGRADGAFGAAWQSCIHK